MTVNKEQFRDQVIDRFTKVQCTLDELVNQTENTLVLLVNMDHTLVNPVWMLEQVGWLSYFRATINVTRARVNECIVLLENDK